MKFDASMVADIYQDRGKRVRELSAAGRGGVGYFCSLTPVEIITAAGLVPFRLAGSMSEPIREAHSYLETIACPFTRSALDVGLSGAYSFLDGYVVPHACDNIVKLYELWLHNIPHKYCHFVNVPHTTSRPSMEFFIEELRTFKASLELYTGQEIGAEKLRQAIDAHNKQRRLVQKIYGYRKQDPPPVSGSDMTRLLMSVMSLPVEEGNALLEAFESEIAALPRSADGKVPRIMLCGTGNEDTTFISMLEGTGARVVIDDLCFGTKPFWFEVGNGEDPLASLARSYLNDVHCPRTFRYDQRSHQDDLEVRFGHIASLAREFEVNGIIYYSVLYCDTHAFDVPDIREYLESQKLPVMFVEEEYPVSSLERLRTRVEAFLEMVG